MVTLPGLTYAAVISFAERQRDIIGVTYGICPEGEFPVLYFINSREHWSPGLSDELAELERTLMGDHSFAYLGASQWSATNGTIPNEAFLGDTIWKRGESALHSTIPRDTYRSSSGSRARRHTEKGRKVFF